MLDSVIGSAPAQDRWMSNSKPEKRSHIEFLPVEYSWPTPKVPSYTTTPHWGSKNRPWGLKSQSTIVIIIIVVMAVNFMEGFTWLSFAVHSPSCV